MAPWFSRAYPSHIAMRRECVQGDCIVGFLLNMIVVKNSRKATDDCFCVFGCFFGIIILNLRAGWNQTNSIRQEMRCLRLIKSIEFCVDVYKYIYTYKTRHYLTHFGEIMVYPVAVLTEFTFTLLCLSLRNFNAIITYNIRPLPRFMSWTLLGSRTRRMAKTT